MSDVIDRLRAIYPEHHQVNPWCVRYEAATEIERLRAENEKLRAVLKEVSVCLDGNRTGEDLLFAVRAARRHIEGERK